MVEARPLSEPGPPASHVPGRRVAFSLLNGGEKARFQRPDGGTCETSSGLPGLDAGPNPPDRNPTPEMSQSDVHGVLIPARPESILIPARPESIRNPDIVESMDIMESESMDIMEFNGHHGIAYWCIDSGPPPVFRQAPGKWRSESASTRSLPVPPAPRFRCACGSLLRGSVLSGPIYKERERHIDR